MDVGRKTLSWRVVTGGGCGIVAELPQNRTPQRRRTVATRRVGRPIPFEDGVRLVTRCVCWEEEARSVGDVAGVVPVILINGWDRFVLFLRQGGLVILFYCCLLFVVVACFFLVLFRLICSWKGVIMPFFFEHRDGKEFFL